MSYIDVGTGLTRRRPWDSGTVGYQRPCIDALAKRFRVLSLPLSGERGAEGDLSAAGGLDNDTPADCHDPDRSGIDRATICGVSFGGLVAVRFAAAYRHRVRALVLASTPGPDMHLRRRHERTFDFLAYSVLSSLPRHHSEFATELLASFPHRTDRWRFSTWIARNLRTCSCICQANGGPGDPPFKEQRARTIA